MFWFLLTGLILTNISSTVDFQRKSCNFGGFFKKLVVRGISVSQTFYFGGSGFLKEPIPFERSSYSAVAFCFL